MQKSHTQGRRVDIHLRSDRIVAGRWALRADGESDRDAILRSIAQKNSVAGRNALHNGYDGWVNVVEESEDHITIQVYNSNGCVGTGIVDLSLPRSQK